MKRWPQQLFWICGWNSPSNMQTGRESKAGIQRAQKGTCP